MINEPLFVFYKYIMALMIPKTKNNKKIITCLTLSWRSCISYCLQELSTRLADMFMKNQEAKSGTL
jgi:hypothetical protein